jgi:sugar phosphate isomerase/epimerase
MRPLTYVFEFNQVSPKMRPYILHEFAANGAKHLVFGEYFLDICISHPAQAKDIRQEMESEGLSFVDSHSYYGPFHDLYLPEGPVRKRMLEWHKMCLETAADFGLTTMAMHVGDRHEVVEGIPFDELHSNMLRALEELLPVAERCGITLSIENAYNICNTPEKLVDAVKHFDSPYLGVCYDAGHANLMHPAFRECETPTLDFYWYDHSNIQWDDQILEKMLPYITCCHLHDNNGIKDQHKMPGDGTIDWKHVMGLLNTAPRLKSFQCESIPVREHISIRELCTGFETFIRDHQGE